jgi:hypothetical protein
MEVDANARTYRQAFSIYFPIPLVVGGIFDLVYSIKLPGELKELSDKEEVMSVYLGRARRGVRSLTFDLCLNFEPQSVVPFCEDLGRSAAVPDGVVLAPEIYVPGEWFEIELGIPWSSPPIRTRWIVENPRHAFYGLRYTQ